MSHRCTPGILLLGLSIGFLAAGTARGGQETVTAYETFPEVPSTWYATGCCDGATIADDIQVAPGTEGMQLASITMRLYVNGSDAELTLHVFRHDEATGLPGALLGSTSLGLLPPIGFQVRTANVWDMGITVPASGRLWIAVYAPGGGSGWNIADTVASIGSTGNWYARDAGNGFTLQEPTDEIAFMNMMLRVEVAEDPCPADLNGDNVVDVDDLIAVIISWGCTDPPDACAGDVNADGIVDVDDLVLVILAWGNCFPV